jgi:hypothetical protein
MCLVGNTGELLGLETIGAIETSGTVGTSSLLKRFERSKAIKQLERTDGII